MKFALTLVSMAFGPIIQAATTPIAHLKCSPGFFLCVVKDSWCNGSEAIVRILTRLPLLIIIGSVVVLPPYIPYYLLND